MASIRISQLASVSAVTPDDYLIVNDNDTNTRKISYANFSAALLQSTAASQTLTGNLTVAGTLAATNLNIDTDVLSVVGSTNRVGINVAGPAYDLDIAGDVQIRGSKKLLFADVTSSFTVSLQAAGTLTASSSYVLPLTRPSSNGQALVSTVAGSMDWATVLTDPMTLAGQMIIKDASAVTTALSPGIVAQVLTIQPDGVPGWSTAISGFADPMTTTGDMIVRNASNVTARLGIGTVGQFLAVGSDSVPYWAPGALVSGSNGDVQFNNGGALGSSGNLNFVSSTATLTTGSLTLTADLSVATVASNLTPKTDITNTLGTPSNRWLGAYVGASGVGFESPDGAKTGLIAFGNACEYAFAGDPAGGGLSAVLNIANGANTHTVGLTVPNGLAGSYDLTFPGVTGPANSTLVTNGSGILSWTSPGFGQLDLNTVTVMSLYSAGNITFGGSQASPNATLTALGAFNTIGPIAVDRTTGTNKNYRGLLSGAETFSVLTDGTLTVGTTSNVVLKPTGAVETKGEVKVDQATAGLKAFSSYLSGVLTSRTNADGTHRIGGDISIGGSAAISLNPDGSIGLNGQPGTAGQVLTSQGSGAQATWTTVSGGGGAVASVNGQTGTVVLTAANVSALADSGGTLTGNLTMEGGITMNGTNVIGFSGSQTFPAPLPAGATTQVQYNNAGALAGSANLLFDGTTTTANALVAGGLTYPTADGTNGQVLTTDGSGALTFTTVSGGGTPAGSDTQIQFNNSGSFGASSNLVFNSNTNTFGTTAISAINITAAGTLEVLGNVTLGDAITDTITFSGRVNSNFVPLTNNNVNLGGPSLKWNNAYINLLNAGGLVYPTADGAAGTVLTSNGSGTLSLAAIPAQTLAAVTAAGATTTTNISVGSLLTVQGDGASADGAIKLNCSQNSHGVTIQAPPHSAAATYTLTLPNNTGTNGQVLTTNGSGVLSFTTVSSGGSPGGATTQVQFNNAGGFAGDAGLTYNSATDTLTAGAIVAGGLTYPTSDGSNGQVLTTDGLGGLTFAAAPATAPAGSDDEVQFNNGGSFGSSSNFTFASETGALGVLALVSGTVATATLTTTGNTVLGDALADTIALNGAVSTDIVPNADDTRLIGSSTARWSQLWMSDAIEFSADAADEARIIPLTGGLQGLSIGNVPIHAGLDANTNNESVFIGYLAGSTDASARGSTVVGAQAGENMVSGASNCTFIGHKAGKLVTKSSSVAVGASALAGTPSGTGQTTCTMVGYAAGLSLTEGSHNVAVGAQDLFLLTTGKGNVSIGFGNSTGLPTSGGGNVFIGAYNSGGSYSPTHNPGTGAVSNTVVMGCSAVANAYVQVAWTAVSDERDKLVMGSVPHGLDFVSKLKPVTYEFKRNGDRNEHRGNGVERYGFLAQDVLALEGEKPVIIDASDEEKLKITSDSLIPVLVNAIKELKAEIEKLKNA